MCRLVDINSAPETMVTEILLFLVAPFVCAQTENCCGRNFCSCAIRDHDLINLLRKIYTTKLLVNSTVHYHSA